jgi:uncharacterized protein YneF (UPF0154 family)
MELLLLIGISILSLIAGILFAYYLANYHLKKEITNQYKYILLNSNPNITKVELLKHINQFKRIIKDKPKSKIL